MNMLIIIIITIISRLWLKTYDYFINLHIVRI